MTWLCAALVTGALSVDAAMASTAPFRPEIQQLRGHAGQIAAGAALTALLEGSDIRMSHLEGDERVQDPYCLRCQPQVAGAALDLLMQAARTLTIEANAVTDNPLVLVETGEIVSGGNFHAEPVAFAADQIALGVVRDRRDQRAAHRHPRRSRAEFRPAAVPDTRSRPQLRLHDRGGDGGSALCREQAARRRLLDRFDADQRQPGRSRVDGRACARRLSDMADNLAAILGIELLVAAQGIGLRAPHTTSPALAAVIAVLREQVPALGRRSLHGRRSRQGNGAGRSRRIAGRRDFGAREAIRFQTLPREVICHEPPTGQRPYDPRAPRVRDQRQELADGSAAADADEQSRS